MGTDRTALQRRVERLIARGDLPAAIATYVEHLATAPRDWSSVTALAELHVRAGQDAAAIEQFARAAEHYHAEGFLPRAAALYKRIIRLGESDQALLGLIDIAAQQGRLSEAKGFLLQLEQQRRDRGDLAGADQCVAVLEAIIAAREYPAEEPPSDAPESGVGPEAPAAPEATLAPEPAGVDAAGLPDTTASLVGSVEAADGVAAPDTPADEPPTPPPPSPARSRPGRAGRPRAARPGTVRPRPRSLQSIFDELRAREKQTDAATMAHERFDLAQYHLREGNEAQAVDALQHAAEAPVLRFAASAQLGRLYVGQGDLARAVQWFERAAAVPPVTPDEGLAVLYELADALQQLGEVARALAVFLELQSQRRIYRDVTRRIEALSAAIEGEA